MKDLIVGSIIYYITEKLNTNNPVYTIDNNGNNVTATSFVEGLFDSYENDYRSNVKKAQPKYLGTTL
jgi:hypothetical protein